MIYSFIFMALMATSLTGMDMPPAPPLIKEIIDTRFAPSLIKEIIDTRFAPCLTLQEMSRFKRTNKEHNRVIDVENLLLLEHSYAHHHLFKNFPYDFRSIILAHYGLTKNKGMFEFLWGKEKDLRNDDLFSLFNYPSNYSTKYLMNVYGTKYSNQEEIQKVRVWQIKNAAKWGGSSRFSEFLKKILPGSGFNIWDIIFVSSKKYLSEYHTKKKTKKCRKKIVQAVCESKDVDLLLAIMGGIIEPRSMKYVFKWGTGLLIEALREKDAFIQHVPDKHGHTFAYYKALYFTDQRPSRAYYGNLVH